MPTYSSLSTREHRRADGLPSTGSLKPAPWSLKVSKAYVFFFWASDKNRHEILPHLVTEDDKKHFQGGLGSWMIIRYAESPVGPYDELLFSPGGFAPPNTLLKPDPNSTTALDEESPLLTDPNSSYLSPRRITRIFVSSDASLQSGRENWGIRKELATFDWVTPDGDDASMTTTVRISDLLSKELILHATLSAVPYTPSFPFSLDTLGMLVPRIVERRIDVDGNPVGGSTSDSGSTTSNSEWLSTKLGGGGCSRLATIKVHHSGGERFPDLNTVGWFGLGVGMKDGCLTFSVPDVVTYSDESGSAAGGSTNADAAETIPAKL
ncbi:hypothetical protein HK097_007467 [Rhizophlyctis rosea]|uniref:Uncharacterized protein n=1 Tax=Rhizophlyctis rosea TaxID=64517 RepID=A0AAD5SDJ7_9FUNG|nr:hypothetical protein HK097_007467 [Rhizophlyctis rosea]